MAILIKFVLILNKSHDTNLHADTYILLVHKGCVAICNLFILGVCNLFIFSALV